MATSNPDPETEHELRLQLFYLKALHEVVREITPLQDVQQMLRVSAMTMAGTVATGLGVALLQHPTQAAGRMVYGMGAKPPAQATLEGIDLASQREEGTEGKVRRLSGSADTLVDQSLRAAGLEVWAPLRVGEGVVGGIGLGERLSGAAYSDDDLHLLETIRMAVEQTLHNAYLYEALQLANAELAEHNQDLAERVQAGTEALSAAGQDGLVEEFIGESRALRDVRALISQLAPSDLTVLILGETGTGKDVAARAVHFQSPRQAAPFVPVNCGAIPEGLVESELFGHEKGAFTSADARRIGRVELAGEGTLFLDEIGDLPPEAQVKLLRLLEVRTFQRVGGSDTLTAQARVIAATNRDLEELVAEGRFREDLFYRIQVAQVRLPPLRERREDIPLLAAYFMQRQVAHLGRKAVSGFSLEAQALLRAHDWPGNVRQLKNTVDTAVVVCPGATIRGEDLALGGGDVAPPPADDDLSLEAVERRHILAVLEKTGWVVKGAGGACGLLGLPESTLRHRMKKLGIWRP